MHTRHVPAAGPRYWTAITIASIAGANFGDFLSHNLHLGHQRGLLPLALALAALLLLEQRTRLPTEAYYWLVIVTLRTGATNLADTMTHDLKFPYPAVIAVLAVLLIALVLCHACRGPAREAGLHGVPRTDTFYWLAMLTAGTLGTALGDWLADDVGLGVPLASAVMAAVLAASFALRARTTGAAAASYWGTVVVVRMAGTSFGDLSAHSLGLATSTTLSAAALVATLALWRPRPVLKSA